MRSNGFNFVAKVEFASTEDMEYFDNECDSYKALKLGAKSLRVEGVIMVYFDPIVGRISL